MIKSIIVFMISIEILLSVIIIVLTAMTLILIMKQTGIFKPVVVSIIPAGTYPKYIGKIPVYHLWAKDKPGLNRFLIILKNKDIARDVCIETLFLCIYKNDKQFSVSIVEDKDGRTIPFIISKGGIEFFDISNNLISMYENYIKDDKNFEKMQLSYKLRADVVPTFVGYNQKIFIKVKIEGREDPIISDEFEIFLAESSVKTPSPED